MIKTVYTSRPIRFLEIFIVKNWHLKFYSISCAKKIVDLKWIEVGKQKIEEWLQHEKEYEYVNYKIGTLIIHEGREGVFFILSFWVDENMMQVYVYFTEYSDVNNFKLISKNGLFSCVWEMAVLNFEREAWIEHVLKPAPSSDIEKYLQQQMNEDV